MSNLKVTYIDSSSTQYDGNADLIKVEFSGRESTTNVGKLYLGDRHSSSFLQLRHRKCKRVVNCDKEIHSLSREEDVKYLNIDPSDRKSSIFEESFEFIDKSIQKGRNVTVLCETGNSKAAAIVVYYVMKKQLLTHTESIEIVKRFRGKIRIRPELLSALFKEEKKLMPLIKDKKSKKNSAILVCGIIILVFGVLFGVIYSITGKI